MVATTAVHPYPTTAAAAIPPSLDVVPAGVSEDPVSAKDALLWMNYLPATPLFPDARQLARLGVDVPKKKVKSVLSRFILVKLVSQFIPSKNVQALISSYLSDSTYDSFFDSQNRESYLVSYSQLKRDHRIRGYVAWNPDIQLLVSQFSSLENRIAKKALEIQKVFELDRIVLDIEMSVDSVIDQVSSGVIQLGISAWREVDPQTAVLRQLQADLRGLCPLDYGRKIELVFLAMIKAVASFAIKSHRRGEANSVQRINYIHEMTEVFVAVDVNHLSNRLLNFIPAFQIARTVYDHAVSHPEILISDLPFPTQIPETLPNNLDVVQAAIIGNAPPIGNPPPAAPNPALAAPQNRITAVFRQISRLFLNSEGSLRHSTTFILGAGAHYLYRQYWGASCSIQ